MQVNAVLRVDKTYTTFNVQFRNYNDPNYCYYYQHIKIIKNLELCVLKNF